MLGVSPFALYIPVSTYMSGADSRPDNGLD